MTKFHINPETGNPGGCRAVVGKCPFGGDDEHFDTAEAARAAFEAKHENFVPSKPTLISEAAKIALHADLNWTGKTPKWLKANAKAQKELFGTEPKIIATIPSPIGELAVVWESDSINSMDKHVQIERGYEISRITFNDLKTGEEVAYLKMGSMDDASYERSFGKDEWAQFAWAEDALGGQFGYSNYDDSPNVRELTGEAKVEAKKKIWAKSHAALSTVPSNFDSSQLTWGSLVNLKSSHAPEDEAELDKDLDKLRKKLNEQIKASKKWNKEPTIDFIRVSDQLRGKGMGHALYVFGARMQETKGRYLKASGIQTPEAESSWSIMKKLGFPINVVKTVQTRKPGETLTSDYFALDFRK